jgi:hypothetical protein
MFMKGSRKAQIGGIIGIVVGIIMIVAVAIPVVQTTITNQAFTGTTKTITDLFPVFLAIGGLVLVAGGFFSRGKK